MPRAHAVRPRHRDRRRDRVTIESADVVLVRSDPRDVAAILGLARKSYEKMVQNLAWATAYNAFAIRLAARVAAAWGIVLTPDFGAVLMSVGTVIVAINSRRRTDGTN
jgi:Cu2+-exporting ATPase